MSAEAVVSLRECFGSIQDLRHPRGVRYPSAGLLTLALIGLMARQVNLQAIMDHAEQEWDTLAPQLGFRPRFGAPHPITLSRFLAKVAPLALQEAFYRWVTTLVADLPLVAAVDGKYPHQSRDENGDPVGILSVFVHDLKLCLVQWVVSDHEGEPTVLKAHLAELFARYPNLRALTGAAIFAQRELCARLVEARRGYLFRIKGNQPNVQAALVETFADAPQRPPDARSVDKRNGCIETRRLWLDDETARYVAVELGFVGAQQAGRLDKIIKHLDTGTSTSETWYLISYDPQGPLAPQPFLCRVRGHWGIENSLQHVKDRSWGEDQHTLRRPGLVVSHENFDMLSGSVKICLGRDA